MSRGVRRRTHRSCIASGGDGNGSSLEAKGHDETESDRGRVTVS
eukprot:CAMPEP_0172372214 /NCGR_PEP_ID=MMETSP1060-20121228/46500_1 /TAXON_ID=37318 /ORGANISM="Pseudo-nitzschia pungens, Strain cf. cingulata" /LENGTH=43 /DNA_ID= /DNA_START= /DNA_END= /DNA_ORIENTATION=